MNIDQLRLNRDKEAMAAAAVSPTLQHAINEYGPILPVIVRPGRAGRFQIIANARTWVAAKNAGYESLPVLIRDASATEASALLAIDMPENPIARARRYVQALNARGRQHTHGAITAIAQSERCSRSQVAHHLRLLELPEPIQQAMSDGLLNAGQGKALVGVMSTRHQLALAKRAIAENWTVRQTEAAARAGQGGDGTDEKTDETQRSPLVRVDRERGRVVVDCQGDVTLLENVLQKLAEFKSATDLSDDPDAETKRPEK